MDEKIKEIEEFDIADRIIEKAYPNLWGKEKGWWILRGAIAQQVYPYLSRIKELENVIKSVKAERDWDAKEMALTELYKVLEK